MTLFRELQELHTLIDFLLQVGLVLLIAFVLTAVASGLFKGSRQDQPPPTDPTVTMNEYLRTVEHDGHWFVGPRNSGGLLHHPDCPCGKAEEGK